ncbi:MAG: tetratricopeptide repeat protein [Pseudomonadota bacterium]
MTLRNAGFRSLATALLLSLACPVLGLAQTENPLRPAPPPIPNPSPDAPPSPFPALPDPNGETLDAPDGAGEEADASPEEQDETITRKTREERLAEAFETLASEDERARADAEKAIARLWSRSGSPSMDLLLERAKKATEKEEFDLALRHLTDLVNLAPDFAEGWNARATVHFRQENYGESLADIAETLALEPRHYGALMGLGLIMDQLDQPKRAIAAYRKALEIHPHLDGVLSAVEMGVDLERLAVGGES